MRVTFESRIYSLFSQNRINIPIYLEEEMTNIPKMFEGTIFALESQSARNFLLENCSYFVPTLPSYINFTKILSSINNELISEPIETLSLKAKNVEHSNHIILENKDSKYAWRKFEIIHPVLYVSLVRELTEETEWENLKLRLAELLDNKSITCHSLPQIPVDKDNQVATQVKYWYENIEKGSLRKALDFEHVFHTDITDCYGSFYTHTITWAMHGREVSKKEKFNYKYLGNRIDSLLMCMHWGQTNGIPQGSILMDLLAEILISYCDSLLDEKIKENNIAEDDYHILRYRDDYRIFTHSPIIGEEILKLLSSTLTDLGLRLNPQKTFKNDDVILGALKPAKLYDRLILNNEDFEIYHEHLRLELLRIYHLGKEFPGSGLVRKHLQSLFETMSEYYENKENKKYIVLENIEELISITTNIALTNPLCIPVAVGILGQLLMLLPEEERTPLIFRINRKLELLPNNNMFQIWMQRISMKQGWPNTFDDSICCHIQGEKESIFDNSWLTERPALQKLANESPFDSQMYDDMSEEMHPTETELFAYYES